MKKNYDLSKGKAFSMCFWAILFIFSTMFILGIISKDYSLIPVAACITALCSTTAGYIGFQMMNNGVKGKFWNQQMYDSQNGKE